MGTKNTRFNVSNCAVYLADSCLISRFVHVLTFSRSPYSSFSCSCDVFSSFACPRLLANSSPCLYCVLAIYSRKIAFSYFRICVFFTLSLIILANSHSRPERENTRERGSTTIHVRNVLSWEYKRVPPTPPDHFFSDSHGDETGSIVLIICRKKHYKRWM